MEKRVRSKYNPTYNSWALMKSRCNNKSHPFYSSYGGRGIRVCNRWKYYSLFLADMGERPEGMTLDRINNDGDYSKENCRWATASEQQRNKRNTKLTPKDIEWIKAGKHLVPQCMMAEAVGVHHTTVSRILRGKNWA